MLWYDIGLRHVIVLDNESQLYLSILLQLKDEAEMVRFARRHFCLNFWVRCIVFPFRIVPTNTGNFQYGPGNSGTGTVSQSGGNDEHR